MAKKILRHTAAQIDNAIDGMQDATEKINKQNQLLESVANSGNINESTLSQVMLNKVNIDTMSNELDTLGSKVERKIDGEITYENILKNGTWELGNLSSSTGEPTDSTSYYRTKTFYELERVKYYRLNKEGAAFFFAYRSDKSFIQRMNPLNAGDAFFDASQLPSDTKYIKISIARVDLANQAIGRVPMTEFQGFDVTISIMEESTLSRRINDKADKYFETNYTPIPISANGGWCKPDGEIAVLSTYRYAIVKVQGDTKYRVSCVVGNTTALSAVVFRDASGVGIGRFIQGNNQSTTIVDKQEMSVPDDCYDFVVTSLKDSDIAVETSNRTTIPDALNKLLGGDSGNGVSDFEVENLERRCRNAENKNKFAWSAFDKPLFVFIHDDTLLKIEEFANVFITNDVPICEAAIVSNINDVHLETFKNVVAHGGEILAHYNASPKQDSDDELWLSCTRDVKKELEKLGFEVRGIIRANSTEGATEKGEKYCRKYFDYANDHMGTSTEYNLPRTLVSKYTSLDAFKAKIESDCLQNGIHAYGFHGNDDAEGWLTADGLAQVINIIKGHANCEITTYSSIYDRYGSSVLAEQIKTIIS